MVGLRTWQLVTLALSLCLSACGVFSCESPIEKERRELAEAGESSEAVLYRGLKVALRSAPLEKGAVTDPSATKIRQLTARIFIRLTAGADASTGTPPSLSAEDYIALAREFYELRDELRHADEDDYPTLFEQLNVVSGKPRGTVPWTGYDSNWEHLMLAMVWMGSSVAPPGFVVYELGQLEPAGIELPGVRLGARLLRTGVFLRYSWPYLADEEATAYLSDLEAHRSEAIAMTRLLGGADVSGDDEVVAASWHAPGVLLRGIARLKKGEEDEALDDLDAFLADAETLGLDDEGVWLVGAYVGIRREDSERALTNLRKLEGSDMLDDDARRLVRDTIAAIEARDPDSAWNKITDKVIVATIGGRYLLAVLAKVKWREQLESSEQGRALLRTEHAIQEEIERIKAGLSTEQLDGLKAKAAESARALGDKTKDKATDVWHRAVGK